MKHTCPCCGYKTLEEKPPGTYEICNICSWEDDDVQYRDPHYEGGANEVSLKQAQQNFIKFRACDEGSIIFVRKVNIDDIKDPHWQPL
ncbi:CPCC family cysteine-rich protein [Lysinibacillus sp. NPDC097287]|uniref:CPCC family cysteine-rich protein n=1 Tax=Lysinibacillus sp. NPDC097287 TaxID=3364144 RepID=UPI0038143C8E